MSRLEDAVDRLLIHWHGEDTVDEVLRREEIGEVDPDLWRLLYELAAVRGGLVMTRTWPDHQSLTEPTGETDDD